MRLLRILKKIAKNLIHISDIKKTAKFWNEVDTSLSLEYWWNNKVIRSFIQKNITGDPEISWYTKKIKERKTPFGRILAFGDGYGMAFEAYITRKDTTEIVYLNISEGEESRFKKKAKELGINIPCTFICANANTFDYTSLGDFDTIISVGAFHHMKNFKYIFPQLNKILKTDGIVYVDEYVGPSKWRFNEFIVDIINQLLNSLPEELIADRKEVKKKDFYNLWKKSGDLFEAIKSDELDSMLKKYFNLVEETSFGGTLLQPFFLTAHLKPCRLKIYNWHYTEIGKRESKKLVELEYELIKSEKIGKDYLYYAFEKNKLNFSLKT